MRYEDEKDGFMDTQPDAGIYYDSGIDFGGKCGRQHGLSCDLNRFRGYKKRRQGLHGRAEHQWQHRSHLLARSRRGQQYEPEGW